ncbi:MAG: hypothetical protein IPK35_09170 [Saprospiraceae bacterium]|jgi:tetratricopeptide (TPR) repeat protein|nr:hypothetical protein [Saprospiraceae bacterium]
MSKRLELLQNMLKNDENDSFLHYAIAKEMESLSNYNGALAHFKFISSNDPGYVGMYYHLGKLYEKMEEQELALEAYTAGINVAKKIPDFHALSELNNAKLNLEMEM